MSEQQLPVLIKIKEFFITNLGFDKNSIFKLKNSSIMTLNIQKARNNSKNSVLFLIKNIHILHNYLIPFFNEVKFISKKGKDFMNFKLSTNVNNNLNLLSDNEKNTLIKASPLFEHL